MVILPWLAVSAIGDAQQISREAAMRAAVHPVSNVADLRLWLSRVPVTRDFPPDFQTMLRSQASLYVIEISTAPGCLPCGDLWAKLQAFRAQYGWQTQFEGGVVFGPEVISDAFRHLWPLGVIGIGSGQRHGVSGRRVFED